MARALLATCLLVSLCVGTIVVAGCSDGSVPTQPSGQTAPSGRPQGTGPVQQLVLTDVDMPATIRTEIELGKENGNFPTQVAGSSTTQLLLLQFIERPPFVLFDRETQERRPIPIEGPFTGDVSLSDRWIIWSHAPAGADGWSLSYCAMADLKANKLVEGSFSRSFVPTIALHEDVAVWIENARQGDALTGSTLFYRNLETGEQWSLDTDAPWTMPQIDAGRVWWCEYPSGSEPGVTLRSADLVSGRMVDGFALGNRNPLLYYPAVCDGAIAWVELDSEWGDQGTAFLRLSDGSCYQVPGVTTKVRFCGPDLLVLEQRDAGSEKPYLIVGIDIPKRERFNIVAAGGEDYWILPGASHRNDPSLMMQTNLQDAGGLSGIRVAFMEFGGK